MDTDFLFFPSAFSVSAFSLQRPELIPYKPRRASGRTCSRPASGTQTHVTRPDGFDDSRTGQSATSLLAGTRGKRGGQGNLKVEIKAAHYPSATKLVRALVSCHQTALTHDDTISYSQTIPKNHHCRRRCRDAREILAASLRRRGATRIARANSILGGQADALGATCARRG